jgi:hypothetical protein
MKRPIQTRFRLLGAIAMIVVVGFLQPAGRAYCHSEFHRYFAGLGASEAQLNPVERVLFSVLLTATKPEPATTHQAQAPAKQL